MVDGARYIDNLEENGDDVTLLFAVVLKSRTTPTTRATGLTYRRYFPGGVVDQEKFGGTFHQRITEGVDLSGVTTLGQFNARFERIQYGARVRAGDAYELEAGDGRHDAVLRRRLDLQHLQHPPDERRQPALAHLPGQERPLSRGRQAQAPLYNGEGYQGEVLYGNVDMMVISYETMAGWAHSFGAAQASMGGSRFDISFDGGYAATTRSGPTKRHAWAVVPVEWELEARLTALAFDDAVQENLNAFSFGYQVGGRHHRRAARPSRSQPSTT